MEEYREIPLTQGMVAIVDAEDYDWLMQWKWCYEKGSGYARRGEKLTPASYKTKTVHMHRQIMDAPEGVRVDHIHHNKLDNRKANLRLCTNAQNAHNRLHPPSKSGYVGVSPYRNRFRGRILIDRQAICLGTFDTAEEAAIAYDAAAKYMRGGFATLNFPNLDTPPENPLEIRKRNAAGPLHALPVEALVQPCQEPIARPSTLDRSPKRAQAWSSTGYLGVVVKRGRFIAKVHRGEKTYRLGSYKTAEEAAIAYDAVAKFLGRSSFGLNFPERDIAPLSPEAARSAAPCRKAPASA